MFRSKKLFPLFLYDADTGNGGGSGNTSTGEGGSGDQGEAGNNTQTGGQQGGSAGGGQQNQPTFTQADLDRIAGTTRKEAMAKFAKDHGFADVKALEAAIKAQKDAEEQAKTDLQKAQEGEQREKTAREAAEAELKKVRIETAILTGAAELNFANPQDALALLNLSGVQIDDAGKVTGHEKLLDDLAKSGRLPMKQGAGIGNQTRTPAAKTPGGQQTQQQQAETQRPVVRF
jgi:hypothetical protein